MYVGQNSLSFDIVKSLQDLTYGRSIQNGEGGRDRTFDPLLKRQMLYH